MTSSDAGNVRECARQHGYEVSERGRLSQEVREAHNAAR
ncbi:Lsr2 family DNA-binding protein [Brachybacterium alimentarium]